MVLTHYHAVRVLGASAYQPQQIRASQDTYPEETRVPNTSTHMASYDDGYEALISAHQGLDTAESHAMNTRLVLLLSNHIGDLAVLRQALRIARGQALASETASRADREDPAPVPPSHAAP